MSQITKEGTILPKRACKFCGREIYLQYMEIPDLTMKWIAFDHPTQGVHHCAIKPLDSGAKKLIHQKLEELADNNTVTTNDNDTIHELIRRIDVMIWNLNQMRDKMANLIPRIE